MSLICFASTIKMSHSLFPSQMSCISASLLLCNSLFCAKMNVLFPSCFISSPFIRGSLSSPFRLPFCACSSPFGEGSPLFLFANSRIEPQLCVLSLTNLAAPDSLFPFSLVSSSFSTFLFPQSRLILPLSPDSTQYPMDIHFVSILCRDVHGSYKDIFKIYIFEHSMNIRKWISLYVHMLFLFVLALSMPTPSTCNSSNLFLELFPFHNMASVNLSERWVRTW